MFKTHNTAMRRHVWSHPFKMLIRRGFVQKGVRALDYGCGRGDDVRLLERMGVEAAGYDPYEPFGFSSKPDGLFDVVALHYVLCVIPYENERRMALINAFKHVRPNGILSVSVRDTQDIWRSSRKGRWKEFRDGFISCDRRKTFQKGYGYVELLRYICKILNLSEDGRIGFPSNGVHLGFRKA